MSDSLSTVRVVATTPTVQVRDFVCRTGAADRTFDEEHGDYTIALVLAGSFRYRCSAGEQTLVPGSVLLGNPRAGYRCTHEYCRGDRCLSFSLAPSLLDSIAADIGEKPWFTGAAIPVGAVPSTTIAAAWAAASRGDPIAVESVAVGLAAAVLRSRPSRLPQRPSRRDATRAAEAARYLDGEATGRLSLGGVAARFDTSPYHFLRSFRAVLGITPHQYLLKARLRRAAELLAATDRPVTDVAFESGFGDLSNFIRTFRAEVGEPPGRWRERVRA